MRQLFSYLTLAHERCAFQIPVFACPRTRVMIISDETHPLHRLCIAILMHAALRQPALAQFKRLRMYFAFHATIW